MLRTSRWFCLALWAGLSLRTLAQDDPETYMSSDEWKQMDQFEAHALARADQFFGKKEFKQAEVEYDSFILEYPKSKAIPYALMRKGRTRQWVEKRYEAIKVYNEVLDYFPDNVNYAAASLFYIGECQQANGNPVEMVKAFTELAQDKDYRKHRLAAGAIKTLADYLMQQGKVEDALKYYEQVAVDFRASMPHVAHKAIEQLIYHHIRRAPDEKQLRGCYVRVSGFHVNPAKVPEADKLLEDQEFAKHIRNYVERFGGFDPKAISERAQYFKYWGGVFENKFPAWDDFQVQIFGWLGDNWEQKVDAQFRRVGPDFDRISWWMRQCWGKRYPKRVVEYYNIIEFAKLDNNRFFTLMETLWDYCAQYDMAANLFDKFDFTKMPESEKERLCQFFRDRSHEQCLLRALALLKDRERADYLLLTFYVGRRDHARGIPQADKVAKVAQYADYALWEKSTFLILAERYADAIAVCRLVNRGAETYYRISDCYVKLGKIDQAVQQLREVEKFFKNESSRACLMIAELYGAVGRKEQQVAVLREVGHKYKESGEASRAHQILEQLGYKTFEGVEATKD